MASYLKFDDDALHELFGSANGAVGKHLKRTVIKVESGAKRRCAVDTGRLRASITNEVGQDDRGLVGRVGTNVDYAPHVEFGTSRMRAQPFLRPALDDVR